MGLVSKVSSKVGKQYTVSTVKKNIAGISGQAVVYEGTGLFGKKLLIYINYHGEPIELSELHEAIVNILKKSSEPVEEYVFNTLHEQGDAFIDEDVIVPWAKNKTNISVYRL